MDMNEDIQQRTVQELRDTGYAVTIFSPEEMEPADPGDVEEVMAERADSFIEFSRNLEA